MKKLSILLSILAFSSLYGDMCEHINPKQKIKGYQQKTVTSGYTLEKTPWCNSGGWSWEDAYWCPPSHRLGKR